MSLPSIHIHGSKNVWSAEDIQWLNYKDVEVPAPRSDDELVEKLAKKGITVAQRTVIKNRKAMNIPLEEKPLRDSHLLDEQIDQQNWQKLSEIAEQWRGEDPHISSHKIERWVERSYLKLRAISTTPSDFHATKIKLTTFRKIPRR